MNEDIRPIIEIVNDEDAAKGFALYYYDRIDGRYDDITYDKNWWDLVQRNSKINMVGFYARWWRRKQKTKERNS